MILNSGSVTVRPLQQVTRTIPIVFVQVVDPVGSGYVDNLARPGGNTTGFTQFEYSLSGKWLELLKEVTPWVTRVAVIRDPTRASQAEQLAARLASMVEASTPMRSPRTSPRSAIKARTQPNTVSCTSWGRRLRVFDSQEWSGTRSVASRRRNSRNENESEQRHSIPRSLSIPSKYPT